MADTESREVLCVLTNVDSSVRRIDFGSAIAVAFEPLSRVLPLLAQFDDLPEQELEFTLHEQYGAVVGRRRGVWTLRGTVDLGVPTKREKGIDGWARVFAGELLVSHGIQERIRLIRLLSDCPAELCELHLFERDSTGKLTHEYSTRITHFVVGERRSISAAAARDVRRAIAQSWLPFKRDYIALAHESFEESFRIEELHLKFLLLVVALEVLFNDGQQELKYRIARGAAALLGRSRTESQAVFKSVKDLYDKRSQLVHAGKRKGVTERDVSALRSIVRRSLVRAALLRLDKRELSERLTAAGFGTYARLAAP